MKKLIEQGGFTLIELLVTLVVLAVLLGAGMPSFTEWVRNTRIQSATNNLAGLLAQARSEAVSRQSAITLAPAAGGWSEGLSMYTDADAAGNSAYSSATDTLIKDIDFTADGLMDGIAVDTSDSADNYISFTSNGLLNEGNNTVTIALCDQRGASDGGQISINVVGRATLMFGSDDEPIATCTP